jgi:hypothetical protein
LIGHLRARLVARFHVQVRLATPPTVERTPAVIPVAGHVVRVFRGRFTVRVGDEVRFFLRVCRHGDEIPPGLSYVQYESLLRATHLEAYLNGSPPACALALDECMVIDGPTYFAQLRASRLSYLTALLSWHLR